MTGNVCMYSAAIDYMTQKLPTRTVLGSQMSPQVGKQCKLCYAFEGDEHRSNTTHCVCVFVCGQSNIQTVYKKKWYSQKIIILDIIVQNVCVFGTIL